MFADNLARCRGGCGDFLPPERQFCGRCLQRYRRAVQLRTKGLGRELPLADVALRQSKRHRLSNAAVKFLKARAAEGWAARGRMSDEEFEVRAAEVLELRASGVMPPAMRARYEAWREWAEREVEAARLLLAPERFGQPVEVRR